VKVLSNVFIKSLPPLIFYSQETQVKQECEESSREGKNNRGIDLNADRQLFSYFLLPESSSSTRSSRQWERGWHSTWQKAHQFHSDQGNRRRSLWPQDQIQGMD
jgi:hypothetical protein